MITLNTYNTIVTGVIGSCWGSFLNAAYYRESVHMSLSKPGSHCPKCKATIPLYLNIPVLGWLFSGGKCFNCKQSISIHYPAIEAIVAGLFLACLALVHTPVSACLLGALISVYILGALYDHQYFLLPNVTLNGALLLALSLIAITPATVYPGIVAGWPGSLSMLMGGLILTGGLLSVKYIGEIFVRKTEKFGGEIVINKQGVQCKYPDTKILNISWQEFAFNKVVPRGNVSITQNNTKSQYPDNSVIIYDGYVKLNAQTLDLSQDITIAADNLYVCRNAMGMGDIRLVPSLGVLIGANWGLGEMFFLACLTGTAHGLYLRRQDRRLPFGPHLMLATAYVIASRYHLVPGIKQLLLNLG